jgi:Secretion system C-terminal sorting domain
MKQLKNMFNIFTISIILLIPLKTSASYLQPLGFDTTNQETIAYDDGTHRTWWCSDRDSFGAAVKFTPREYPCQIVGTRAEINYDDGTQIYLRIYDDNGPNGLPGTVLYNERRLDIPHGQQTGFKDYDLTSPVTITSGNFYICFFQKNVWDMLFGTDQAFDSVSRQFWYFPDLGWQTPTGMDAADHLIRAKVMYGVGIEEIQYDNTSEFQISPNPCLGRLQLRLPSNSKTTQWLELYNVAGQKVNEISISGSPLLVDLSDLPLGLYFVKLRGKTLNFTQKLVIKR